MAECGAEWAGYRPILIKVYAIEGAYNNPYVSIIVNPLVVRTEHYFIFEVTTFITSNSSFLTY